MTELVSYSCDCCGAVFGSRGEAEACEKSHRRMSGTGDFYYASPAAPFPEYIRVDFEGCASKVYAMVQGYQNLPQKGGVRPWEFQ